MQGVNRVSLALVLASGLASAGCGADDDSTGGGIMDAGADTGVKLIDSGKPDTGSSTSDASAFPCSSGIKPAGDMCGGSHCQETLAQMRAKAQPGAVCGGDLETNSFCQLEAVNAVKNCTLSNFGSSDPDAVAKCSAPLLPGFNATCLVCFAESAKCAAKPENCLNTCLAGPDSYACDYCRVEKGCIASFYACAGLSNPVPPITK
jgi:hypothetical protein